jgi:hypothetical protein
MVRILRKYLVERYFYIRAQLKKRTGLMDEVKVENEVNSLLKEIGGTLDLQCVKMPMPVKNSGNGPGGLQKTVDRLQESLDYLRVCVKYQKFDLEATRRENEYLRKLLEDNSE